MIDVAVVHPYDMSPCFEAQDALARAAEGDDSIRVEKALHFADPGMVSCRGCSHHMMQEGDVMLCGQCGTLTHVPTRNKMTWDQVWMVNHRQQRPRQEHKLSLDADIDATIAADESLLAILERHRQGIKVETAIQMELGVWAAREQELRDKIRELRRFKTRLDDNEYWIWMGDGEDHPESLSCPVVIAPDTLRAMVHELTELRAIAADQGREGP